MIAILKSSERKVADIAVERAPEHVVQAGSHAGRHVRRPGGGYSYGGGDTFFDLLFGGRAGHSPYRPRAVPTYRAATATAVTARARSAKDL